MASKITIVVLRQALYVRVSLFCHVCHDSNEAIYVRLHRQLMRKVSLLITCYNDIIVRVVGNTDIDRNIMQRTKSVQATDTKRIRTECASPSEALCIMYRLRWHRTMLVIGSKIVLPKTSLKMWRVPKVYACMCISRHDRKKYMQNTNTTSVWRRIACTLGVVHSFGTTTRNSQWL